MARDFFQIEPPRFLTLSLTHWLGLDADDPATVDRFRQVERSIRDLDWNPDRHLPEPRPIEAVEAVEAKWRAIEGEVVDPSPERIDRHSGDPPGQPGARPLDRGGPIGPPGRSPAAREPA